jgi:hypothetical protein
MKKLHEEMLCNDSASNQTPQCSNCGKEALLKQEIKGLDIYISSLHREIEMLHKQEDLLQQRVSS